MTAAYQVAVAIDWGGTWFRASVVDRQGEILWQNRVGNFPGGTRERLLADAEVVLGQAVAWCEGRSIAGVGIAAAGPVDDATGTLHDPPNLAALNGLSLKARWEPSLGYPVFVGNDATLAALGEFHHGAGPEAARQGHPPNTLVYVTVSTGIGGGVVDRGRVFLGAHGLAGEVGHMAIDWRSDAVACTCGSSGCLEALASGQAVARIARTRLAAGGWESSTLSATPLENVTSEMVFDEAGRGDALCQSVVEDVVQALAVGLTNVIHVYNPDLVVLGGGVTRGLTGLGMIPRINSLMLGRAMSQRHRDVHLAASVLGDSVGMVGAASLVWSQLGEYS
jgi:glucokinase